MQGTIGLVQNGGGISSMELNGVSSVSANIGFFTLAPMQVALTYEVGHNLLAALDSDNFQNGQPVPPATPSEDTAVAYPYLLLSNTVLLGTVELPLSAKIWGPEGSIRLQLDLTTTLQTSLTTLVEAFQLGDISALVPDDFSLQNIIGLTSLFMDYDPTDTSVTIISNIGIELENTAPWEIMTLPSGQVVSMERSKVNFTIYDPLGTAHPSFYAGGVFQLTEVGPMEISMAGPPWAFSGFIPDENVLHFGGLMKALVGSPSGVPELDVSRFDFYLSGNQYSYYFVIELDWWIIDEVLEVDNMSLSLTGDSSGNFSANVQGTFDLNGLGVIVDAAYPGPQGGWTFTGYSVQDTFVSLADLATSVTNVFGITVTLPSYLNDLAIKDLFVSFNSATRDFAFHCGVDMVYNDVTIAATIEFSLFRQNDNSFGFLLGGTLTLGTDSLGNAVQFDLYFSESNTLTGFVGAYRNLNGGSINLGDLVSTLTDSSTLITLCQNVNFTLTDGLIALIENGTTWDFLLALDWGFGVNISNLPLVGQYLDPNETVELAFQVTVATSAGFTPTVLNSITALLPPDTIHFPPGQTIVEGLGITTTMRLGGNDEPVTLPIGINSDTGQLTNTNPTQPPTEPIWFNLQKEFGPVHISRVGLKYIDNYLLFYLDANMDTAGLSFTLTRLYFGTSLTDFTDVQFGLDGLAADFDEGGVQIGGMLLRQTVNVPNVGNVDQYSGALVMAVPGASVGAIGSFAMADQPSFFVYGAATLPIGGPPWLMLQGLSLGAGFNRSLIIPPLDQVMNFPLVSLAMAGTGQEVDFTALIQQINPYLGIQIGEYWIAAGISFTSFEVIDGFVLATLAVGNTTEVNLLGIGTVLLPPTEGVGDPLAELQLAIQASFNFNEGHLYIGAQLTGNSYILSRQARITGGFAFSSWFYGPHAGDFVLSVGGYHPKYIVPSYYPTVPRLGLNWQISSALTFKGGLYFALTPSNVMAGGSLEATWTLGSIKAWFTAGIDFLMGWLPFTYDANAYITVGASYTFDHLGIKKTLSYEVGANLHVWGPDFSGIATVDLGIISFDISFGAARKTALAPVTWETFFQSFLPGNPVSATVKSGLVKLTSAEVYQVSPAEMGISITSAMPLTSVSVAISASQNQLQSISGTNTHLGVSPMGLAAGQFQNSLLLTIIRDGELYQSDWEIQATLQQVPAALWDGNLARATNGTAFVPNALTGVLLKPVTPYLTENVLTIPLANLSFETTVYEPEGIWTAPALDTFQTDPTVEEINDAVLNTDVVANRANLMATLGITTEVNLSQYFGNQFLSTPQIIQTA